MYAIGRQKSEGVGVQEGWREKKGSLCDICHFDPRDLTAVCRGFPVKFFPPGFENKFYCFFDSGERFFPGLTLADRAGNLHALYRAPSSRGSSTTVYFMGTHYSGKSIQFFLWD